MKRIILSFLMLTLVVSAFSQIKVGIRLDMKSGSYGEMTCQEMLDKNGDEFKAEWDNLRISIAKDIAETLNKETSGDKIEYGWFTEPTPYLLTFAVQRIEKNGKLYGFAVAQYVTPDRKSAFYKQVLEESGDDTKKYTKFTSKCFTKAAKRIADDLKDAILKEAKKNDKK